MRKICNIYIQLVAVLLVCTAATAHAQVAQPAAWSSKPMMSEDVNTDYQFRSTSTCTPIVGSTPYISDGGITTAGAPQRGPRRGPWDDDWNESDADPIGVYANTPVGEPLVLLVLALLYIVLRKKPTPDPSLKGREI